MQKSNIYLLVLISLLYIPCFSANYYVSTNGNDSNPGSFSQPFKTIQKGINVAQPGDTVFVRGGTYSQGSSGLQMVRSGSAGSPIVFMSYPGELAVIQFSSSGSPNRGWDWNGYKNYLEIHGFEIIGSSNGILAQGNFNKITHCKVHDIGSMAINIWGGSNNLIAYNNCWNGGWNCYYLEARPNEGHPANDNIIEFNIAHDFPNHFGINVFPKPGQTQSGLERNIIRYNIVYSCGGGSYFRAFEDGEIYGNLFYDNGIDINSGNGILLGANGGTVPFPSNTKIYNNTVYHSSSTMKYYALNNEAFKDLTIKNNIFVHQNASHPPVNMGYNSGCTMDNNLYHNPNGNSVVRWAGSDRTLAYMQSVGQDLNSLNTSPNLASNFRPNQNSPVIDEGTNLGSPYNYDLDGNQRGADGFWDIGAFEYGSGGGGSGNSPPNQPTNPNPPQGAVNQPVSINLSWSCTDPDGDPLTYDVYFGTSSNPPLVAGNISNSNYNPGTLANNSTYYWKIVAKDNQGNSTVGNIWSFSTSDTELISLNIIDVTASVVPEPNHTPDKTIDGKGYYNGDPDSRWAGEPIPEWICFDLGEEKTVSMTKLEFYKWHDGRIYEYSISVSTDNITWNTAVSNASSSLSQWSIEEFSPVVARYIKIDYHGQNQNNWAGLWEGEVWGNNSATHTEPLVTQPEEFSLSQNYPNPFNPSTKISVKIPQKSFIKLAVYNIVGEITSLLAEGEFDRGIYEFTFSAYGLPSGIYIYRLESENYIETKKMILMK